MARAKKPGSSEPAKDLTDKPAAKKAVAKKAAAKKAAAKKAAAKQAVPTKGPPMKVPVLGPSPVHPVIPVGPVGQNPPVLTPLPPIIGPVLPIPPIGLPVKVVTGAGSIAGSVLLQNTLGKLDAQTRATVAKALESVLPQVLTPGTVGSDRTVPAQQLAAVVSSAAVSAAGLDLASTPTPPPPVLWDNGSSRLVVQLDGITATLGNGLIELAIPVSCDQAEQATVTVTFVTGSADAPSGGVATTEDHPRGPAAVVEVWHEPLIAFAWHTVLLATAALAGAIGTDTSGSRLIPAELAISPAGLTVTPMAQHSFLRTSVLP